MKCAALIIGFLIAVYALTADAGTVFDSNNPFTDSLYMSTHEDSLRAAQAQGGIQPQQKAPAIKLVKREFKYREQIFLALGMMAFVLVIMTLTENLNPTPRQSL
jgi:hypothetical protein